MDEKSGSGNPGGSESDFDLDDPFEAALAAAPLDDEPFTAKQRASAAEGWQESLRGEAVPLGEIRRQRQPGEPARRAAS